MSKKSALLIFSLFIFFSASTVVLAQTSSLVQVSVEPSKFSDELGSFVQGEITLENTSDEQVTVRIGISNNTNETIGSNVTGFFGSLRFYGDLPEDFEDLLEDSGGDVAKACESRDDSNDLDNWCDGEKIFDLTLEAEQTRTLPYTFRIPLTVEATNAFLLVESVDVDSEQEESTLEDDDRNADRTGQEDDDTTNRDVRIFSQELQYEPPVTEVISGEIKELKLIRSFGKLNFWGWIRAGFRETYEGSVLIENIGTTSIPYTVTLNVERSNADKEEIQQSGEINQGEEKTEQFQAIAMPRLGTALIDAELSYEGNDGPIIIQTEQARVANTPIKEMITTALLLIGAVVSFFVFRRTKSSTVSDSQAVQPLKRKRSKKFATQEEGFEDGVSFENAREFESYQEISEHDPEELVEAPIMKKTPGKTVKKAPKKAPSKAAIRRAPSKSVVARMQEPEVFEPESTVAQTLDGDSSPFSDHPAQDAVAGRKLLNSDRTDIDWIGEDDTAFESAMRIQEKKMNMKVGSMVLGLLALVVVIGLFLGNRYLFSNQQDDGVSISELSESQQEEDTTNSDRSVASDASAVESDDESSQEPSESIQEPSEELGDAEEDLEQEPKQDVSDIIVQVLNAGSTAGAAGELSQALEAKGYEVLSASNARNDYVGNVVYYAQGKEDSADQLIEDIGSDYGSIDIESEQTVLDSYAADLVVVLGS